MWSCIVQLDEEKLKHGGLVQENGFSSIKLESSQWLVKGAGTPCTYPKECNKCDLIIAQCF
jgi:hypothetical protein